MVATVIARFRDKDTLDVYDVGQPYEGSSERVTYLVHRGFLKVEAEAPEPAPEPPEPEAEAPEPAPEPPEPEAEAPEPAPELGSMTNPELAELLRSLGVEPPKKANKGTLVALVREARGE